MFSSDRSDTLGSAKVYLWEMRIHIIVFFSPRFLFVSENSLSRISVKCNGLVGLFWPKAQMATFIHDFCRRKYSTGRMFWAPSADIKKRITLALFGIWLDACVCVWNWKWWRIDFGTESVFPTKYSNCLIPNEKNGIIFCYWLNGFHETLKKLFEEIMSNQWRKNRLFFSRYFFVAFFLKLTQFHLCTHNLLCYARLLVCLPLRLSSVSLHPPVRFSNLIFSFNLFENIGVCLCFVLSTQPISIVARVCCAYTVLTYDITYNYKRRNVLTARVHLPLSLFRFGIQRTTYF